MVIAALVVLASLNRETAFVLIACYWAVYGLSRWRQLLLLASVYAVITIALHLLLGSAPHMLGLEGTLAYNLDTIGDGLFVNVALLPLWVILARRYRHAPPVLKRCVMVGAAYMLAIVVGGAWAEMLRLVWPVLVLVLPIMLSEGKHGNTRPDITTADR